MGGKKREEDNQLTNFGSSFPSQLGEMIKKLEKTETDARDSFDKYSMLVTQQTHNSEDTSQLRNVMICPLLRIMICVPFIKCRLSLSVEIERTRRHDQRIEGPYDRPHHHQPQLPQYAA